MISVGRMNHFFSEKSNDKELFKRFLVQNGIFIRFFYLTKFSSYFVKTLVQKESVIKYSVSLARQQSFFTYFVISIIFKAGGKLQIFLSSFKNGLITVWRWMLQLLRRKCHHFYRKNTNKSIERHFLNVTLCSLNLKIANERDDYSFQKFNT